MTPDSSLRLQEQRLGLVLNVLPIGVVWVDEQGRPTCLNRAAVEHLSAWVEGRLRPVARFRADRLPDEIRAALGRLDLEIRSLPGGHHSAGSLSQQVEHSDDATLSAVVVVPQVDTPQIRYVLIERHPAENRARYRTTDLVQLSEAERKVALAVLRGLSNRAVAGLLGLSEHTVKSHLQRVFRKLSVQSRTELVVRLAR